MLKLFSVLRRIPIGPDDLVVQAYDHLEKARDNEDIAAVMAAWAAVASAEVQIAAYLKEHRG
ncbi:hypothetical protein QMK19_23140 [Streptomyces sp. H10-C2]|uniref:hypothetical protein n=1 Tax=unclassified Streptomyces TaxID=2593676 RepID=UPI0024BBAD9E|nr:MULTISPECIES: hypothetical protein [unclassified Streptomyces]MDJ0342802.1 hypothetical protein [Streptomyces sp. PH10-H1]MDJ0372480.1 hypothetical protein [Streptomyces sp. H10-C2]